jgi:hypothetical protein
MCYISGGIKRAEGYEKEEWVWHNDTQSKRTHPSPWLSRTDWSASSRRPDWSSLSSGQYGSKPDGDMEVVVIFVVMVVV